MQDRIEAVIASELARILLIGASPLHWIDRERARREPALRGLAMGREQRLQDTRGDAPGRHERPGEDVDRRDGGATGERVPTMIRWPGTVINDIGAHEDMLPTLVAAAGNATVAQEALKGAKIGKATYKVHLDGYDLGPALRGEAEWPRKEFIYWTDDGNVAALRYGNWKATFLRQDAHGMKVWQEPFVALRAPMLTNLRMDPFELAADIGMDYERWFAEHMFMIAPAAGYVGEWLQSFREFPPRQKPGSFNLDRVMEAVTSGNHGAQ